MRGILCDVWVSEKSTPLSYSTTELFFSRPEWNVVVEEVNANSRVPVAIATYNAKQVC